MTSQAYDSFCSSDWTILTNLRLDESKLTCDIRTTIVGARFEEIAWNLASFATTSATSAVDNNPSELCESNGIIAERILHRMGSCTITLCGSFNAA
jgi:hypothetical protein